MFQFVTAVMLMLSNSAWGQSCSPEPTYTCSSLDLFGQSFDVEHRSDDIAVGEMGAKMGVTSLVEEVYRTSDSADWIDITDHLELNTVAVPGLIVEAALYTDVASPMGSLSRSDVDGVGLKIRRLGRFYHRYYKYDSPSDSYVEVVSLRDHLTGTGNTHWPQDMQWLTYGGSIPSYSSVWRLVFAEPNAWSGLTTAPDLDVQIALISGGSSQAGSIPTVQGNDIDDVPGGGGGVKSTSCRDSGRSTCNSELYPACTQSAILGEWGCDNPNDFSPNCPVDGGMHYASLLPTSTELTTMYALRDHMQTVSSVRDHIAGYYAVGSVIDWTDPADRSAVVAAYAPTMAGATKIMAGPSSAVVVPDSLHTQLTSLLTSLEGRNVNVDGYISALKSDLDDVEDMTRAQFCTHFTGVSNCGL